MESENEQTGRGRAVLQVALVALAFGCVVCFLRAFATGSAGVSYVNSAPVDGLVSAACSWARFAALIVLTVLGCLHRSVINRASVVASGAVMAACALVRALVPALAAQVAVSVLVGVSSAFVMFALVLLLSSKPLTEIVASSLAGFAVGGAGIAATGALPAVPALVLMALAGLLPGFLMMAADPKMRCCEDQGELSRFELARFPWFSSIMLAAAGFLGSLVYGIATTLVWNDASQADPLVMGLCALAAIAFTAVVMLFQDNWVHTVWVPYLLLLFVALALLCTSGQTVTPATMGVLVALIMSYHFLRWMVFPAIVSTSLLPRVLTNGIFLVLTNSVFNVDTGAALATVLPMGLQTPTGLGGTVSLALAVVFAIVMFVERMDRYTEDEVYVAVEPDGTVQGTASADGDGTPADAGKPGEPGAAANAGRPVPPTIEERCEQLAEGRGLTSRETEIFSWTARGYSSAAIAEKLYISSSTVRFHQQNLYKKLGVHSKQELIQLVAGE